MSCSTEAGTTPEWSIFGGEFFQKSQLALTEAVLVCHIHIYTCVHNYYDCVVYPYFQRYIRMCIYRMCFWHRKQALQLNSDFVTIYG